MSEELNEDISDVGDSQLSTNETSQTQPQLQQYLTNIFGSDDSDDDHKDDSSTKRPQAKNADEESLFGDSDDDEVATKRSRLVKSGARKVNKRNASTLGNYDPNASESEDDIDGASRQPKSTTKPIKLKKRKHSEEPKSTQKSSNKKIPKRTSKSGNLSNSAGTITGNVDGGDEYDSGEEVQRTKEDDDFIDRKDDNADLMEEYNEDQVFDDSPARSSKSAKKKAAQSRANGDSSLPRKAKDALSEALEELKKPKITVISEHDRSHIVEDLMKKMDSAHKLDEALYAKKEPAVNKLKMLSTVQQMLSMKELQESFLKLHILTPLKRWIQPKKNGDLPSLTVRTAVYELLLKLPCQSEDLKWTDPKEDTVGAIVADLRRHKKETVENKRLLKDIMEKWSRPVFQKSTDVRGLGKALYVPAYRVFFNRVFNFRCSSNK